MDKVELILKEIERLMYAYNLEADIASAEDKEDENIAIAKYNVCTNLRDFINSILKEQSKVWHDASEIPQPQDEDALIAILVDDVISTSTYNKYISVYKDWDVDKWAYLDDIINL